MEKGEQYICENCPNPVYIIEDYPHEMIAKLGYDYLCIPCYRMLKYTYRRKYLGLTRRAWGILFGVLGFAFVTFIVLLFWLIVTSGDFGSSDCPDC